MLTYWGSSRIPSKNLALHPLKSITGLAGEAADSGLSIAMKTSERIEPLPIFLEKESNRDDLNKNPFQWFIKRAFDLTLAFIFFPIFLPLMAFIALFIKLDSKGPIFFIQRRVGKGQKIFNCYKFRSMVENAPSLRSQLEHLNEMEMPAFKLKNDPRITKFGYWLRKYSLDELPQIFNVFKGEMSFVGPRPPLPQEVENYKTWQKKRLTITPGLTCLWQINGRNRIYSFDDWVRMDLEYIENRSIPNDLKIMLKTMLVVLKGTGY